MSEDMYGCHNGRVENDAEMQGVKRRDIAKCHTVHRTPLHCDREALSQRCQHNHSCQKLGQNLLLRGSQAYYVVLLNGQALRCLLNMYAYIVPLVLLSAVSKSSLCGTGWVQRPWLAQKTNN